MSRKSDCGVADAARSRVFVQAVTLAPVAFMAACATTKPVPADSRTTPAISRATRAMAR